MHSPTPWTLIDDTTFSTLGDKRIVAANRISPGIVFGGIAECQANAEYIVRAVNSHDALVNALMQFVAADDQKSLSGVVVAMRAAREALKLAGVEVTHV